MGRRGAAFDLLRDLIHEAYSIIGSHENGPEISTKRLSSERKEKLKDMEDDHWPRLRRRIRCRRRQGELPPAVLTM